MSSHSDFLLKFTKALKHRDALPKNIEISHLGRVVLASIYDDLNSEIIAESIFTGMDIDSDIAVLKGLVEMVERRAFQSGKRQGLPSCQTTRSDGFAAFPIGIVNDAVAAARHNAFHEAIERFAWASWWDNRNLEHGCAEVRQSGAETASCALLEKLADILDLSTIFRVTPKLANGGEAVVAIYFAFLEPYGVISGGACGPTRDIESINFRAACELSRHALAVRRIREMGAIPATFYEKRLAHFALTKEGSEAVKARLAERGNTAITLPGLEIDESVPHKLEDIVAVYRCHFKGQPPFVGGELERLCL